MTVASAGPYANNLLKSRKKEITHVNATSIAHNETPWTFLLLHSIHQEQIFLHYTVCYHCGKKYTITPFFMWQATKLNIQLHRFLRDKLQNYLNISQSFNWNISFSGTTQENKWNYTIVSIMNTTKNSPNQVSCGESSKRRSSLSCC